MSVIGPVLVQMKSSASTQGPLSHRSEPPPVAGGWANLTVFSTHCGELVGWVVVRCCDVQELSFDGVGHVGRTVQEHACSLIADLDE